MKLVPYIKPYMFKAILAVGLCIPIGLLDGVIALSLKPYTDLVMVEKSTQAAWYIPFVIVVFAVVQGVLSYLAVYLNSYVGEKITRDLKLQLYRKLLSKDPTYFDRNHSGEIITRFNTQADNASAGLLAKIKVLVSRIFSSISLIGVLFYNSVSLSLIAMLVLGCAFYPVARIRKKVRSITNDSIRGTAVLATEYNESYAGNKVIAAYNLKQFREEKFKGILDLVTNIKILLTQKTAWLSPVMHVIVSVGIGISITYGSYLIVSGKITNGNFVSFLTALIMLYNPVKNIGNNIREFQISMVSAENVLDTIDEKSRLIDSKDAIELKSFENSISFENLTFGYREDTPVLRNINFEVSKGETIAIVGNSGGGKTTLLNLLPRFYDISHGSIKIDGIDIKNFTIESLRNNIAIVFQDNFLFSGTIRDNIRIGNLNASQNELDRAIENAYLDDFICSLKDGIESKIGERGVLISGGQRQRIAIARAFLKNAPILILDEATSALDNKSEEIVQKAIDRLMRDKTVFVIAHRLSTIKNASRIAVINNGKLVELGRHEELINIQDGFYKNLYETQFK